MNKIIFLPLLLSGCMAIDAYNMSAFDTNEYQLVNQINSLSEIFMQRCNEPMKIKQASDLMFLRATELKNYTQFKPHNEDATKLSTLLYDQVQGLYNRYSAAEAVSEAYCRSKLDVIRSSTITMQTVIGSKSK